MIRIAAIATIAWILGLSATSAQDAAANWPSKPVRVIVAAAPGGNPDILGRLIAQKLTNALGKPFVVENVPGAGGVVAAKMVAGLPNDGHVIMLGDSGAMAINVALTPDLPYKPLTDFTPVTALAQVPTVLVTHPSVEAKNLAEFVALAKAKPGAISYGSAGQGSVHHLTMAVFAARAGIDVLHAPYRGGTALVGALMKGEVQSGWSGIPNVKPLIEQGTLKVLAISTEQRSKSLPNVPTAIEQGLHLGFQVGQCLIARNEANFRNAHVLFKTIFDVARIGCLCIEREKQAHLRYGRFLARQTLRVDQHQIKRQW